MGRSVFRVIWLPDNQREKNMLRQNWLNDWDSLKSQQVNFQTVSSLLDDASGIFFLKFCFLPPLFNFSTVVQECLWKINNIKGNSQSGDKVFLSPPLTFEKQNSIHTPGRQGSVLTSPLSNSIFISHSSSEKKLGKIFSSRVGGDWGSL